MVKPLIVAIRNSLFPVRSVLQSTSAATFAGGAMHHGHQPLFFSSTLFGPLPRQGKGKERERSEPRRSRVLQCREWSCCSARNFLYCPTHGIPFMLQELLPLRERPARRFQNPKTHLAHRFSKYPSFRARNLASLQRRHTSHTARLNRAHGQSQSQPEASTSRITQPSGPGAIYPVHSSWRVAQVLRMMKIPLVEFNLEDAWQAFNDVVQGPQCLDRDVDVLMLDFVERYCDKVGLFYRDDDSFDQLKIHREHFRTMVDWIQQQIDPLASEHFIQIQHLVARSRTMHGQFEAAVEILENLRGMKRENFVDPSVAKTYTAIYSSIFYFHDALQVMNFLDQHFFFEYFRPPYCMFYHDDTPTSLAKRHPQLLYILSSVHDPASLFKDSIVCRRSKDWQTIGAMLLSAYCRHNHSQHALRVLEALGNSKYAKDDLLKLRLVNALASGGYFDDAIQLFSQVRPDTRDYRNTGARLFALKGDYSSVKQYYKKARHSHLQKAMVLLSLAVEGRTTKLRHLFKELFPKDENGEYIHAKPTVMEYAISLHGHARRSNPEGIKYWIERMEKDGIKPNQHAYSSIIQSYLRSGNLGAVADILEQMRQRGVMPNAVVYTNVITALGKYHKPSVAEDIFKRALRENIKPDQAMVGSLLNAYVAAGQWNEAVTLFRSLENNRRSPLQLTIEMYNIALKGYVIMGAPFRVVATLFEQLDADENVRPTAITFALLLQSACESGNMGAAMDIYKEMARRAQQGAKSLMNPFTFTILMSGFLRQGDRDQAMVMYQKMLDHGIQPTSVTFNTVLQYYSNAKSADSTRLAYEFMTRVAIRDVDAPFIAEDNLRYPPLELVYEPVLRGAASVGKTKVFEKLLEEMLEAGGEISVSTITYLLDLYRQKGHLRSATKAWKYLLDMGNEVMKAARFPVEGKEDIQPRTDMLCVPLTIYLDALSQAEKHHLVLETWREYREQGFSFNFFNWNRLGEYLICAGEYERAFEVTNRIILPYIRVVREQAEQSSPSESEEIKEETASKPEPKEIWPSPFEVLNETSLSFLQGTIVPNRPLGSSSRSKKIQRRSFRNFNDDAITNLAFGPPSTSTTPISPPPISSDSSSTSSISDQSSLSPSSSLPSSSLEPQSSRPSLFSSSSSSPSSLLSREPLTLENVPDFVRPLYALSFLPEGTSPKIHFTLLHHLLIGLQRLRAGQPPIPSSSPAHVTSEDDLHYGNYSWERQREVKEQLDGIYERYPDAVNAVLEFEDNERIRLGDDYERLYRWG